MPHFTDRVSIVKDGALVLDMSLCAMARAAREADAVHDDVIFEGVNMRFQSVFCGCTDAEPEDPL